MSRPDLRVVEPAARATTIDPERRLRTLFRAEAAAEKRLAGIRGHIAAERSRYAAKHRLGFLPSLDRLRSLFGARP